MTINIQCAPSADSDKSSFSRRRLSISLIIFLACIIGLQGSLPHLFFSRDLGERIFFEGAWDEAFYSIVMSAPAPGWNDYPARALMRILMSVAGGPDFIFATCCDVIWPMLVVLSAGFLALTLTRSWVIIIPMTFLLVFCSDIMAFNSSAIYPPQLIISYGLRSLPIALRTLIPDAYTPFLYIYRTPEPQLSLSFFFCYLAILVRFLKRKSIPSTDWVLVFCAAAVCTTIYVFFAAACLMATGLAVLSIAAARRWRTAAGLLVILSAGALLFVWLTTLSHSGEAKATLFHSRLPMVAPSLIYGGLLAPLLGWRFRNELMRQPQLFFGLLCLLMPIVTLNQQVATGLMLQTLNWERYINYPFLVLGLSLLLRPLLCQEQHRTIRALPKLPVDSIQKRLTPKPADFTFLARTRRMSTCILFLALAAIFVYRAQLQAYRQFAYYNLRAVAYAKLLNQIETSQPSAPRNVTLDDLSLDAPVRVRIRTSRLVFNGYTDLVLAWKDMNAASDAAAASISPSQRRWGFEHAARLGFSRKAYEAELLKEISQQNCWPHLMFQFSFLECAPYVSDFRLYSPERLREKIPEIGREYEAFIQSRPRAEGAFVLRMKPISGSSDDNPAVQSPVAALTLALRPNGFSPEASVEVRAYRSDL